MAHGELAVGELYREFRQRFGSNAPVLDRKHTVFGAMDNKHWFALQC
jgi:hypothetical protein